MNNRWSVIRNNLSIGSLCASVAAMPFSIVICQGSLILFILLSLTENNWAAKRERIKNNSQLILLIALAFMFCAGILYSENQDAAWFAIEKKIFFFLLPIAVATSVITSPELVRKLSLVFCFSCFVALVLCCIHATRQIQLFERGEIGLGSINYLQTSALWDTDTPKRWMFFSYVSLSEGISMHPTYLALYCSMCCIILIKEQLGATGIVQNAGIFLLMAFFSVAIVFLASRIIIVMLTIIYVLTLGFEFSSQKSKTKSALVMAALLGMLVVGVILNPVTRFRQIDEILSTGVTVSPNTHYTNSTDIRASLWWLSMKAYLDSNLMIGTGAGDVQQSVRAISARYGITNVLQTCDPHNQYLYFLLSSGMIGFSLFISYVGMGLFKAWKNRDIIFLNFLMLFSVVCITESALELQKGIVFFSIFFSCMTFSQPRQKETPSLITFANAGQ